MAKCKLKNIDDLIDSTEQFASVSDVKPKKKDKAQKEAEENPTVAEHVQVGTPANVPAKPKAQVIPMDQRDKLPANAVAPSSSVLDHLKEKRDKENKRAAAIVGAKKTGEIQPTGLVTDLEARVVVLEHLAKNNLLKAS